MGEQQTFEEYIEIQVKVIREEQREQGARIGCLEEAMSSFINFMSDAAEKVRGDDHS